MKFLKVSNIKLSIDEKEQKAFEKAIKIAGIHSDDVIEKKILKYSIDARKKPEINKIYTVLFKVENYNKTRKNVTVADKEKKYDFAPTGTCSINKRPIIVGFGPAGMFCGYMLAKYGYKPIIIERGSRVDERIKKVNAFWNGEKLDTSCNVQFGEGGAGTFSDGKLNTGIKDKENRIGFVLNTFVKFGANPKIEYDAKPHIGTDLLRNVVAGIREEIRSLGGDVRFEAKVTDFVIQDGKLTGLIINDKEEIKTEAAILAPGHSARDTFKVLSDRDLEMNPKAFAIGLRVEHPREMIDHSQYGKGADQYDLPAASYKLTYHANNGRSVYSFCMCPGGFVVNASSEPERLTVNGMSNHDRAAKNSNSAIIASVTPEDFDGNDALAGVRFQQKWEEKAFSEGKGRIPVQTLKDFREGKITESFGEITPNTKGLTSFGNLRNCLPEPVSEAISEGMEYFDTKIKGFNREDTILCGIEARTSSPLRIERDQGFESNIKGIYPCGEGAGFAGGITSAAMDGIKVAQALVTV